MVKTIRKSIFFICISLLFCALSWFIYHQSSASQHPHQDIDSNAYLERADLMVDTNSFIKQAGEELPYYGLGYPVFLSFLYWLFGQSVFVIIIAQILLALLALWLLISLAFLLFGEKSRVPVGLLFLASVGYATFVQFVLTEILLATLLLLFFYAFINGFMTGNRRNFAYAGIWLGLSIMVKPAALIFSVLACACIFLLTRGSKKEKFKHGAFFLCMFLVPVFVIMGHNKIYFNTWALGNLAQVNLYYWFYPNVLAHINGTSSPYEQKKLIELSDGRYACEKIAPLFWQTARERPYVLAFVWLKNVCKTMFGLYTTNLKVLVEPRVMGGDISFFMMHGSFWQKIWGYITAGVTKPWVVCVGSFEMVFDIVRYFLCVLGLLALCRKKYYNIALFSLLFLGYFFMITGHDGCSRFRMMVEFLLIVLAAGGVTVIKENLWERQSPRM
jgi:4-amino-4-deoxy-L-arabinose transferase-like glycosyltransferase